MSDCFSCFEGVEPPPLQELPAYKK